MTHHLKSIITLVLITFFISACGNSNQVNTTNDSGLRAQEKIKLRLAHGWPKGFPYFGESVEQYAELVHEMSNGQIEMKCMQNTALKSC